MVFPYTNSVKYTLNYYQNYLYKYISLFFFFKLRKIKKFIIDEQALIKSTNE